MLLLQIDLYTKIQSRKIKQNLRFIYDVTESLPSSDLAGILQAVFLRPKTDFQHL